MTVRVSNSALHTLVECETKFVLEYVHGYAAERESPMAFAGNAAHQALAAYLMGVPADKCLDIFRQIYGPFTEDPENLLEERLQFDHVYSNMEQWFNTHPRDRLPWTVDPNHVEMEFEMPLDEHGDYIFVGVIDALVKAKDEDSYFTLDWKTTRAQSDWWVRKFVNGSQMTGYLAGARDLMNDPTINRAYIGALTFKKLNKTQTKCSYPKHRGMLRSDCWRDHVEHQILGPFERTKEQIDDWHRTALKLAKRFERLTREYRGELTQEKMDSLNIDGAFTDSCRFSLTPSTPVALPDHSTRPLGDLQIGDELLGFDEFAAGERCSRRFRPSYVEGIVRYKKQVYRLITDESEVLATDDHPWLAAGNWWLETQQLANGVREAPEYHKIRYLPSFSHTPESEDYRIGYFQGITLGDGHVGKNSSLYSLRMCDLEPLHRVREYLLLWGMDVPVRACAKPAKDSHRQLYGVTVSRRGVVQRLKNILQIQLDSLDYVRGFMSGFFDAEGSYSRRVLRMAQKDRAPLERIKRYGLRLGFRFSLEDFPSQYCRLFSLHLQGGLLERIRFFVECLPAITRKTSIYGERFGYKSAGWKAQQVRAVEPVGVRDVIDVQTSTRTFIANGLASHNCQFESFCSFGRRVFTLDGKFSKRSDRQRRSGVFDDDLQ